MLRKKKNKSKKIKSGYRQSIFSIIRKFLWNAFAVIGLLGGVIFLVGGDEVEKGITYDYDYNSEIAFAKDYIINYYSNNESSRDFIAKHSMSYIILPDIEEGILISDVSVKDVSVDNKNIYINIFYRLNDVPMNSDIVMSKSKTNVVIEPLKSTIFAYSSDKDITKKIELDPKAKMISDTTDHYSFLQTFYRTANDNFKDTKQFYSDMKSMPSNMKYDVDSITIVSAGTLSNADELIVSIDEVLFDTNNKEITRQKVILEMKVSLETKRIHEINRGGK